MHFYLLTETNRQPIKIQIFNRLPTKCQEILSSKKSILKKPLGFQKTCRRQREKLTAGYNFLTRIQNPETVDFGIMC